VFQTLGISAHERLDLRKSEFKKSERCEKGLEWDDVINRSA
jgi:hypothetical protein